MLFVTIYLLWGIWAAGYLIGWRKAEAKKQGWTSEPDLSEWLMLVTISLFLGPIMLAGIYFTGIMDKHDWTLYLRD